MLIVMGLEKRVLSEQAGPAMYLSMQITLDLISMEIGLWGLASGGSFSNSEVRSAIELSLALWGSIFIPDKFTSP